MYFYLNETKNTGHFFYLNAKFSTRLLYNLYVPDARYKTRLRRNVESTALYFNEQKNTWLLKNLFNGLPMYNVLVRIIIYPLRACLYKLIIDLDVLIKIM